MHSLLGGQFLDLFLLLSGCLVERLGLLALLFLLLHLFILGGNRGFVDLLLLLLFCNGLLHIFSIFRPLLHGAEHSLVLLDAEALRHAHVQLRGLVDVALKVDGALTVLAGT